MLIVSIVGAAHAALRPHTPCVRPLSSARSQKEQALSCFVPPSEGVSLLVHLYYHTAERRRLLSLFISASALIEGCLHGRCRRRRLRVGLAI